MALGCSVRTRQCLFTVLLGFRFLKVSNTVREAETNSPSVSRFATSFHPARSPPPTSPEESPPSSVLPPPSSPPAALSVSALLTCPHQPGENRTGPPRSGRSPITATASKPARRTRPTLRPFSWRVQAVVYVQNFKNITQVTPLLRWLPAAPGGWGGCHAPPWLQTSPACCRLFSFVRKAPLVHRVHHPGRFLVLKYVGFFLPLFFLVPLSITLSVTS